MRLLLDYPWYFVLFCLLAGAAYSVLLYRRSTHFGKRLRWLLAALRFVAVTCIAFLLLSPMVRMVRHDRERPIVVVAQDNSRSLALTADSTFYRTDYLDALRKTADAIGRDYEVHTYRFDGAVDEAPLQSVDYGGVATDMSALFQMVADQYRHRNLGAVVVAGDGLFNQSLNPTALAQQLMVPVYCVAMGDTTLRRDAAVGHVRYNQRVTLHDKFPIEVTLLATNMQGVTRTFRILHNGRAVATKQLHFDSEAFVTTETFLIEADQAGLQQYTLTLDVDNTEYNPYNNRRTLTVEVSDRRTKVAILVAAPHPDVAALRRALTDNADCEATSRIVAPTDLSDKGLATLKRALADVDVVVLHNLVSPDLYRDLCTLRKPVMHIVGEGADLAQFNAMRSGIEVQTQLSKVNEATAVGRTDFGHFDVPDALRAAVESFPPLQSPFGEYRAQPHVQPLFYAKIGSVVTDQPLVALSSSGLRQVWVMGDGLWRWRLTDFRTAGSHDRFDLLLDKLVTFVRGQADGSRFRVVSQPRYRQGEAVQLEAELYDDNGELTQQPAATISFRPADGSREAVSQPFVRTTARRTYNVNLGLLPAGSYRYHASTVYEGESLTADGAFVVEDFDLEAVTLTADHALLRTLAFSTGGEVVPADSVARLTDLLRQRGDIKTLISSHMRYDELLRLPWLLVAILLLLSLEWIVRKYNGSL